ncbi:MAG: hypothetical protein E7266_04605 [Lachnospiraceae bacterium]|nr:hypothetical protein [Lachnospiraceae bacterium]
MKNVKIIIGTITLMMLLLCVACGSNKKTNKETTKKTEMSESDKTDESERGTKDTADKEDETTSVTPGDNDSEDETTSATPGTNDSTEKTTADTTDETEKTTENNQNQQQATTKPSGGQSGGSTGGQTGGSTGGDSTDKDTDLDVLVDYVILNFTNSSMNQLEKALAIHDYLTCMVDFDYADYVSGKVSDQSKTALGVLRYKSAVSEGYAQAFYEICKAAGFEVKVVSGTAVNGVKKGYQPHTWNQIKIDNVWYNVDVMLDDPAYEDKGNHPSEIIMNSWDYFLISDATLKTDHKVNGSVQTCTSDYSSEKIAKAIATTSVGRACEYITGATNLTDIVNSYSGGFEVYMVGGAETAKNLVDKAISSTTKPFREMGAVDTRRGIAKINVIPIGGLTYVATLDEMVSKIKADRDSMEDFFFRYINPNVADSEEMNRLIETTLNKAGIEAFVSLYSGELRYGRLDFSLSENPERVQVIQDFAELKDCMSTVQFVHYVGNEFTNDQCAAEFLKNGIYPGNYQILWYYNGVQCISVSELESVEYYDSIETLKKDIKNRGFSAVKGKRIAVNAGDKIYNSSTYRDDFMFEMGFEFTATEFNKEYGHLIMELQSIDENVYVSKNLEEFIEDINTAKGKNALNKAQFYCKLIDNAFDGYTKAENLVAATGCNVTLKSCGGLMGDGSLLYWIIELG